MSVVSPPRADRVGATAPSRPRAVVVPWAALVLGVLAVLVVGGVGVADLLRFALYLLLVVIAPGVAAYRALSAYRGGLLRQLAFGWALGHALLIGFWLLAGILGVRAGFAGYPLLVLAACAPWALRSREGDDAGGPSAGLAWALAAMVVAFVVSAAVVRFEAPLLEGLAAPAFWDKDTVYFMSLIAEAKWHAPLEDPNFAGLPLYYHYFSYVDLAAASRVAGIDLTTLALRFDVVVPHVLVGLLAAVAGRSFSGRWSGGVLAAGMLLLVGELDLDPGADKWFRGHFAELERDTSFHYGAMFFLPSLVLVAERLGLTASRRPWGRGDWAVLAILLVAAGGAKAPALAVVLGGLGLFVAVRLVLRRRIPPGAWSVLAVGCLAFAVVTWITLPREGSGTGLAIAPGGVFDKMLFLQVVGLRPPEQTVADVIALPLGVLVGLGGMLGAVLVGLWFGWRAGRLDALTGLLIALLVTGLVCTASLVQGGNSEDYFAAYGYAAASLAAAVGFDRGLRAWPARRLVVVLGVVVVVVGGLAVAVPELSRALGNVGPITDRLHDTGAASLLVALVLAALALGAFARLPLPASGGSSPRPAVALGGALVLLLLVVVGTAEHVVPAVLTRASGNPYGEILLLHVRIAFALWAAGVALVAVLAWRWARRGGDVVVRAGLVAVGVVAAGLVLAGDDRVPFARPLAALGPALLLLGAAAGAGAGWGLGRSLRGVAAPLRVVSARLAGLRRGPRAWLVLGAVSAALLAVLVAALLGGWLVPRAVDGAEAAERRLALVVVLAAALGAVGFLLLATSRIARSAAPLLVVALLLAPALLDLPIDVAAPVVRGDERQDPREALVSPAMADALRWVRDHSDPDDVIATDHHHIDPERQDPRWFYAAALAERRTFLGGFGYSEPALTPTMTSPALRSRQALNRAAFRGDPRALARLRDVEGVRYLVVDRVHGGDPAPLARRLPVAFANREVTVAALPIQDRSAAIR